MLNNLQSNRTYIWKVRPFGRYDGCTAYSTPKAFTVGTFVDSKDASLAAYGLRAFPQPASLSTGHFSVEYEIPGNELAQLRLINSSGQIVQTLQFEAQPGKQTAEVPTRGLPPGFYLLELTTSAGRWVEKLSLSR
ncbi:T9SS type A sorting domain-containing protein [Phaeodactylibacter xiamenensis]